METLIFGALTGVGALFAGLIALFRYGAKKRAEGAEEAKKATENAETKAINAGLAARDAARRSATGDRLRENDGYRRD